MSAGHRPVIGEPFARALAGYASFIENQRMFLDRNGYLEETFFTFSFSPIRDETGGVGGVLNPCHETTGKILLERRTRALRDVAARTGKAKSVEEVLALSAQTLTDYDLDLPFILLYALDASGQRARLAASTGLKAGTAACPHTLDLEGSAQSFWPVAEVFGTSSGGQVDDIGPRLGAPPYGPYPEPPKTALLLPIMAPGAEHPAVVLVVGVSPRLPLDEAYRNFLDLLAAGVTGAIANTWAYAEERKRAEALTEIDRAKTAFFSNVSHEFRTPLTLLLGPLEELKRELGLSSSSLSASQYHQVDLALRNGLRLLKLTNTLLDFSRIEAGRMQAVYEPTDLATYTAELASVFRSAIEKAGLRLIIDCPPLAEPTYVDREMWEKIVHNLLSNAFKFTFAGEIEVKLRATSSHFDLTVHDTGTGIPADEVPKLFERFHRVAGAHGLTHEGSGIGLALVQELARLHGGSVAVKSTYGKGSIFRVLLPCGRGHLPADQIGAARTQASNALGATLFIEEAQHWLPDAAPDGERIIDDTTVLERGASQEGERAYILLADDNADMREYLSRLFGVRYEVEAVGDGEAALAAIEKRLPDLVLSDIMMPRLGGLELLARLRANPRTKTLPIILLSARAGEEARLEGLAAGADEYLVKPFSAREVLAQVAANINMAKTFRNSTHNGSV